VNGILRQSFPLLLVAFDPPLAAVLAWSEGHGKCGGLTFDSATQRIGCTCGPALFQVTEVTGG
jgi:hypothetical protein